MDVASRAALLDIANVLRLRTGQLVMVIDLLEEVAVREQVAAADILDRPEIRRIASGPGSAPSRASALLEALRMLRFPRLKKMRQQLRAEISALRLPRAISLDLPKNLGSDEVTVSLRCEAWPTWCRYSTCSSARARD